MDWDLSPFFDGVESEAYDAYAREVGNSIEALKEHLANLAPLDASTLPDWRAALDDYEGIAARHSHLMTYIYCIRACDVTDTAVQRAEGQATQLGAEMTKLRMELLRGVGRAEQEQADALTAGELEELSFFVERLRREAARSMGPQLEGLAADLGTDGISAWGRLYNNIAGKLELDFEHPDGRRERIPMAQRRSLMRDPNREVRKAAFAAGNRAWRDVADTVAAALNHIAGTRLTLYRHRGIDHFLDVALEDARITQASLDAMFEAVERHAEVPRRYLRLKARAMGLDRISWFDLEAPVMSDSSEHIPWDSGKEMIRDAFGASYPALRDFFDRAIERRWVEHSPRPGKAPGAFCASSPVLSEARIYMTYQNTFGDVSTLAHEIGHGFHSHVLRSARPLARRYPMTLAESASTFAELILSDGLLARDDIDDAHRTSLLAQAVGDGAIFLLDITTRFHFERSFYEERADGELSVAELEELMVSTQREVFGDALAEGGEDPLFWASKLHFFITGVSFYNFPYTFGYLLSRGLRAMHEEEGDAFLPRYEAFLAESGKGWAHEVVRDTLGRDLESPGFWEESILSLVPSIERLESLLTA
jgi:oligoendopeptidase F